LKSTASFISARRIQVSQGFPGIANPCHRLIAVKAHVFTPHQVFDDMAAAVREFPREDLVCGVIVREGSGADQG